MPNRGIVLHMDFESTKMAEIVHKIVTKIRKINSINDMTRAGNNHLCFPYKLDLFFETNKLLLEHYIVMMTFSQVILENK